MPTQNGMVAEDDISFDLAFAESLGGSPAAEPEVAPTEPATEGETANEEPVAEPKVEVEVTVPPQDDTRYRKIEEELAELRKVQVAPTPKPEEPKKLFTDEEEAFLEEFGKEWPDAQKALAIQKKAWEADTERRIQAAVQTAVQSLHSELAPVVRTAQESAQERFIHEVTTAHPDARTLMPEIERWIKTLPSGLGRAYDAILDSGTAADTVELFNMYKKATGKSAPAPVVAPQVVDKEAKLQKLEGVRAERTGVSAEADPYDFESAFAQAVKQTRK